MIIAVLSPSRKVQKKQMSVKQFQLC